MPSRRSVVPALVLVLAACGPSGSTTHVAQKLANGGKVDHVLLLSVDGLHEKDLERYVAQNPSSAMARLVGSGISYTHAQTSRPSDSFPGLMAQLTGGSPQTTGVWYDDSFDRSLFPPGSNCAGTPGTRVLFDETLDLDPTQLNGGGGLDPNKFPLSNAGGVCTPFAPHQYVRVNNVFEVIHATGSRTAWSDKHLAYDLVRGPSGTGVDDLYTPEIAATDGTVGGTETYDDLKVTALLHEIDGLDSSGQNPAAVPALFGMNFQAVSVTQKAATGGYLDASATPSAPLADALAHTDASLAKLLAELKAQALDQTTLVILSAKHGNSPIDPSLRKAVNDSALTSALQGMLGNGRFQADDGVLVWLQDQSAANVAQAQAALSAISALAGFDQGTLFARTDLSAMYDDPTQDSRTPDLIIRSNPGVIYTTGTKIAEHGGFSEDDVHVPLVLSNPAFQQTRNDSNVQTTQIAPTLLLALGLDPSALDAVKAEGTQVLPGMF
jgi:hypothetical protein